MAQRNIRFTKNIVLKVDCNGDIIGVPFGVGDIYDVEKIEKGPDGFCDIFLTNPAGSVIKGISEEIFENMGKRVPVIEVEAVEEEESTEFEVEAPEEGPALLAGTMLSSEEEENDEPISGFDG